MEKHAAVLESRNEIATEPFGVADRPELSIVVVSTNEGRFLDRCLESVLASKLALEVLVINNDCSDETEALCSEKYKHEGLRMIRNERRKSLPENANIGLRLAKARYVMLLNP